MGRVAGAGAMVLALVMVGSGGAAGQGAVGAAEGARLTSRGGSIAVKVADFDAARQRVLGVAGQEGAELLDGRSEVNFQGKRHGWMRFRLPVERLPLLLPAVRGAGKVYSEKITTADNTSEYEELERRVGRLREHQQRLAAVLQSPRRMRGSDILYLQERLFRASVDEGLLLQRRADLERAARVSTVVVELFEPEPRRVLDLGNYYAGAALRARLALYRALARGLTGGAYVLAFAPFWGPALALMVVLGRRLRRRPAWS